MAGGTETLDYKPKAFRIITSSGANVHSRHDMQVIWSFDLTYCFGNNLGNGPDEVMGAWGGVEVTSGGDEGALDDETALARNIRSFNGMIPPNR